MTAEADSTRAQALQARVDATWAAFSQAQRAPTAIDKLLAPLRLLSGQRQRQADALAEAVTALRQDTESATDRLLDIAGNGSAEAQRERALLDDLRQGLRDAADFARELHGVEVDFIRLCNGINAAERLSNNLVSVQVVGGGRVAMMGPTVLHLPALQAQEVGRQAAGLAGDTTALIARLEEVGLPRRLRGDSAVPDPLAVAKARAADAAAATRPAEAVAALRAASNALGPAATALEISVASAEGLVRERAEAVGSAQRWALTAIYATPAEAPANRLLCAVEAAERVLAQVAPLPGMTRSGGAVWRPSIGHVTAPRP